jgi:sugar phosphate isomerase/epimerase
MSTNRTEWEEMQNQSEMLLEPKSNDFQDVFYWQWENKGILYWTQIGRLAEKHHLKITLVPHGGFYVHTPNTLLKLREAVGEVIGANFDPIHMWWQGMDPVQAIQVLGRAGAIYHFHAKDTSIDPINVSRYGLTDMQPFTNEMDRAWQFRTVGCGDDLKVWADMISALRLVGYDDFISIEHEDG